MTPTPSAKKSADTIRPTSLTRRRSLQLIGSGAAAIALPALASWPEKPIKIIVTFPAGGASDIVARVMGEISAAVAKVLEQQGCRVFTAAAHGAW